MWGGGNCTPDAHTTRLSHHHFHWPHRGKRLPGPYNAWPFGFVWQIREWRKHNTWWIKSRELFTEHGPLIAFRVFCESRPRLAWPGPTDR